MTEQSSLSVCRLWCWTDDDSSVTWSVVSKTARLPRTPATKSCDRGCVNCTCDDVVMVLDDTRSASVSLWAKMLWRFAIAPTGCMGRVA